MTCKDLLSEFIAAYPAQPATAYWRAIEIGALIRHGLPQGLGLDLGCGDGILTRILLSHTGSRKLVGIDPDPLEAGAARKFSFYDRVHVTQGDAIPEEEKSFDFILSNSVLEHIPQLDSTLCEASRVLKRCGQFLFTVPGPRFRENLAGPLSPGVSRETYLKTLDQRLAHLNYLDHEGWREVLSRHGLQLDNALGYLDRDQTCRWETLSRMTGGLFYSIFGGRKQPIEIQRTLGMRDFQNRAKLPDFLARAMARAVSFGVPVGDNDSLWLAPESASCLLLVGHKP
ncbi:class I SAM-dependent methyltransferase [Methylocystis sp. JR02]|uniref:class I SAM-dependent methyltransferase n=1 Tax=Methylocystis sp. JR02 TaxID=3046284 RepID=UPI0024BA0820|nr:class I SAM-dependent methyltransferase [Methylocystis sp. JR02]MDJ0450431.1 methyltransferase domain-containing protein [Methylocystis sp. JR02]